MLPNRFPDAGEAPQYNSVDASLWFVIVAYEYMAKAGVRPDLVAAAMAILRGYSRGTRYGIRMDEDGLLACGEPGVQLTWMDARVGDREITPRIGKPVEVQALWINAMRLVGGPYAAQAERAQAAFRAKFFNALPGCLYDVVDVEHHPGRVDTAVRPNQIFAVGGLPHPVIEGDEARLVVDTVERELLTPAGLRTLARADPEYRGQCRGERQRARRRVPPGHRVAVAHGGVRRRMVAGQRRRRDAPRRGARPLRASRCKPTSASQASDTFSRSPMATRRTRRAGVRSRRGRWGSC